jgi:hypothetical protein
MLMGRVLESNLMRCSGHADANRFYDCVENCLADLMSQAVQMASNQNRLCLARLCDRNIQVAAYGVELTRIDAAVDHAVTVRADAPEHAGQAGVRLAIACDTSAPPPD